MQEIPKEHFRPVPEAFPDLKLRSNAALQTPAFAGLLEKAGTGPRRQGFRSAIDLHILREFRGQGRPKQTLRQEKTSPQGTLKAQIVCFARHVMPIQIRNRQDLGDVADQLMLYPLVLSRVR